MKEFQRVLKTKGVASLNCWVKIFLFSREEKLGTKHETRNLGFREELAEIIVYISEDGSGPEAEHSSWMGAKEDTGSRGPLMEGLEKWCLITNFNLFSLSALEFLFLYSQVCSKVRHGDWDSSLGNEMKDLIHILGGWSTFIKPSTFIQVLCSVFV